MALKLFALLLCFALSLLTGCTAPQPIDPTAARSELGRAWRASQHTLWEMNWPAAPSGSPVVFEVWQAGGRYRFEILESPSPDLMGAALVFDERTAWLYNRLLPEPAIRLPRPALSPATDAFAIVGTLLERQPEQATRRTVQLEQGPAEEITLKFATEAGQTQDRLILWLDPKTGLPWRVQFGWHGQEALLEARQHEPLAEPPPGLFERMHPKF